jgi:hypothetical protein
MDVVRIPKEEINKVWILVREYIRNALIYSGSHHHADHYKDLIKDGKLQLWIIWDEKKNTVEEQFNGLVLSQIIQRSIKKVLHLPMVTGKNRQQWQDLIVNIENFAIDQGCDCMELIARPGWQKILDKHKYYRTHVVLEKNLKKEEK